MIERPANATDPAAIGELYKEVGFLVHRRCKAMLRDEHEAMDVTHWTFVRALEHGLETTHKARAIKWLYVTATHRCLTLIRNSNTRRRLRDSHRADIIPLRPGSPEQRAISSDLLHRSLDKVEERCGMIALYAWGQGMGNDRIAEMLKISKRTVIREKKHFEAVISSLAAEQEAS